jgi:hypothetical protein
MSGQFVLATPNQHGNQTILHGKTLPDISLGSMAASFDADAQEELDLQRQNSGVGGHQRDGMLRNLDENSQSAKIFSGEKWHSLK